MASTASSAAPATGGLDRGLIATIRLVLASSVLFIISPSDLEPFLAAFYVLSALYIAYSAILYVFARRQVQPLLHPDWKCGKPDAGNRLSVLM